MNFTKPHVEKLTEEQRKQCILDWRLLNEKGNIGDCLLRQVTLDCICNDDISDMEYVVMACYDCLFDQVYGE